MMKTHCQSVIVVLALLGSGVWQVSHAIAPIQFQSVVIESHPAGGGYAHKTVQSNGTITGAHQSGSPDAVRVYESKADLTSEDMVKLNALVSELRSKLPKGNADHPDKMAKGYASVIIHLYNERTITFHSAIRDKQWTGFEQPAVQAIWDFVYKYNVGAW